MFSQSRQFSKPLTIVKTYNLDNYDINVSRFVPNTSISFNITLRDTSNNWIKNYSIDISGNDYQQWSNDDSYITNYIETYIENDFNS